MFWRSLTFLACISLHVSISHASHLTLNHEQDIMTKRSTEAIGEQQHGCLKALMQPGCHMCVFMYAAHHQFV